MDMYQKRKMRAEKKNNCSQERFSKVSISWYPGHMAKTKREIKESLNLVDIVYEVIDARMPLSSKIIDIDDIVANNFLMNVEGKYLCSEDCKGLCQHCGADLNEGDCGCSQENIDPRWAALVDIMEKDK